MSLIYKIAGYFNKASNNILIGVIGLITLIVYKDIFFGHEFLLYDDKWYIYENENVTNLAWSSIIKMFTSPFKGQYSPIAELYHSILYYFFGKDAIAFKFFSLVVHFLNTILVFNIINKISEYRSLAIFVSFVFSLHPMQVEAVAWLSAIYRIAAFFMLLGYLFYIKYLDEGLKKKDFAIVAFFFILALLTKEQAILFPIGLVLINLKRGHLLFKKRVILENIFFAIVVLIFGFITIAIVKTGEKEMAITNVSTFTQKFYLLIDAFLGYIVNFLWPFNLSFSYPHPKKIHEWGLEDKILEVILFVVTLIILTIASYRNRDLKFGILWGLGFLSLAFSFSFLHIREVFMADRYIYIAIIGFAYVLFYFFKLLEEMLKKNSNVHLIFVFCFLSIIIFSSHKRVPVFKNEKTLWTNAIAVNNRDYNAYNYIGKYYATVEGDLDKSLLSYLNALNSMANSASSHISVGKVYFDLKKYEDALKHIDIALELNPNSIEGYSNRIAVNIKLNRHEDVLKDLDYLIAKEPLNVKYIINRASTYFKLKEYEKTIEDCKKILLNKDHGYAFYLLGHSQFLLKRFKAAEESLTKAIAINKKKGSYYFFRSLSRFHLGEFDLALEDVLIANKYKHPVSKSYLQKVFALARNMK